jgi:hypothetical protein
MKNCVTFLLVTILLFGCEKQWDDPIPEGEILSIPRLIANLNEDGRVLLDWDFHRKCEKWTCDPVVEGSHYEIFVKYPDENDFVSLARIGRDENEYMVPNTEFGKPYEFYITSQRAGQETTSNTVMTVPNSFPEYEAIIEMENWNAINYPKVNIQGDKVAYISNYRLIESGPEYGVSSLFLKDLTTGHTEMIREQCYHPQWSRDGSRLVYGTSNGLNQVVEGYTPIHLEMYDLENKEISLLKDGSHHHYFPTFAKDDQSLLFMSDSLERKVFGLWRLNHDADSEVLLPEIRQSAQFLSLRYHTSMDVSSFSDLVSVDIRQEVDNRQVFNIYRIDLNNGPQKSDLVVSPWNDTSSSFSIFQDNLLAFVSDRSGIGQVWVLDISSGKLKQVSFLKEDFRITSYGNILSWVDQGQSLAFPVSNPTGERKLIKMKIPN